MKLCYRSTLLALLAVLVAACPYAPALAASQAAPKATKTHNIASEWMIWNKRGQSKAFETNLKQLVAWRKSAGDPLQWKVYAPMVGDDLGYYLIRSDNHTWADMESGLDWAVKHEAGQHYQQSVGPHAMREAHYFIKTVPGLGHWIDSNDYRYFGVTNYRFKTGTSDDIKDVLEKVHKAATDQKWSQSYAIIYGIGGSGRMAIVEPMKSLADMAPSSPNLMQLMTKSLGSKTAAKALLDKFSSAVEKHTYTILVYRPDLSTPEK